MRLFGSALSLSFLLVAAMNQALMAQEASQTINGLPDLIEKVKPSVVHIEVQGAGGRAGVGSGFIVGDRLVATNHHVIAGASEARITLSNHVSMQVEGYVAVDEAKDLILLRLKGDLKLAQLAIASHAPRPGEAVVALGSSVGLQGSVSEGIVSGVRKEQEMRDAFKKLGVGRDATHDDKMVWIQTTAAISGGNSGGPLVTLDGRVVGVNTLSIEGRGTQNLNFAVSADHLLPLLRDSGKEVQTLGSLISSSRTGPRLSSSSPGPRQGLPFVIKLPSGTELSEGLLRMDRSNLQQLFKNSGSVYTAKYPNGQYQGIFTYHKGKLDGPSVTLYDDGELHALANYAQSQRNGIVMLWERNRTRLLYAEYKRSNKSGIVCLFRNGDPSYIQEWDKGDVVSQYLVRYKGGVPEAAPLDKLLPEEVTEVESARKKLDDLEAEMLKGEREIKKLITEVDKQNRLEAAGNTARANRAKADARQGARNTRAAADVQGFWKTVQRVRGW